MNLGIIGLGYWGTNLVRNFANLNDVNLKVVADARPERANVLTKLCPTAKFAVDANEVINDPEIDAIVIATPVFTLTTFLL